MRMRGGAFATPPVVLNLLIANIVVFAAAWLVPAINVFLGHLALYPVGSGAFHTWQLVTYMFLHANGTHLLFNMFGLWMFGRIVEYDMGSRRFLIYYMVCGVGAGLIQLLVGWLGNSAYPTVGASGAIFGILLAFGMMRPNDIIMLLIPPIPMKAKWMVIIYGLIELFSGIRGSIDNVAHFAHLGGMLWGFLLLWYWKKKHKIRY